MNKSLKAFNYIKNDMRYSLPTCKEDEDKIKEVNSIVTKELNRLEKYDKAKELIKKKKVDVIHILNISKAYVKELWSLVYNKNHTNELTQEEFNFILKVFK